MKRWKFCQKRSSGSRDTVSQSLSFQLWGWQNHLSSWIFVFLPPFSLARVNVSSSPRTKDRGWDKSASGLACASWAQGTEIHRVSRHKWDLVSVSHPASAAGTFSCLFPVRRTPIRKSVIFGSAGNCTIRFLPGKLVAVSTYTSFSWCFLLLFLYTVLVSPVPVCNFQVI
jgi:hypothetical protein